MKKKLVCAMFTAAATAVMLAGCGDVNVNINNTGDPVGVEDIAGETAEAEEDVEEDADRQAAQKVADLIDAIYVQEWTPDTDAQCKAAREAWDALTDGQKDIVEGENADPDYFGRDTGDASKDDPLNGDDIGENEILVVSFGTSFNDSRVEDISGVEKAIAEANPDWSVRRAFTSQIIINHINARDDEKIDNMKQALDRAVENGVKNLVVQPTHLMHGAEYDEMMEVLSEYASEFETVKVGEPLLGEVGSDATMINKDKEAVAGYVTEAAAVDAGFDDVNSAADEGIAIVLMGHGTSHTANVTYDQMQTQMAELKYDNVFIGTVEGEPEDTACEAVMDKVKEAGYKKVILRSFMVVAGDHANNDMAGDEEDSWKNRFLTEGGFESVDCQVAGLGRLEGVQELYVNHVKDAMESEAIAAGEGDEASDEAEDENRIPDGTYEAKFTTDSSMFHVNEANKDMGILTVKDGEMTIHVSLAGDSILNLFPGTSEDAQKKGAKLLEPTKDEVTYEDGTTETVNGFDIPVPALDEEFDLALIGKKGKWYDHKVSVTSDLKEIE